jgi:site-specific DNA-methyltransferase (cytosine-N4-specific)
VSLDYRVGDVFDRLAEIPDGSVDLIVTSPPFLALRSYLPADHPDKHREIGSEPTPAAFIDTLLALSAEWGRVLAPHGSLCVELGDTFAGSGGAGGDYGPDGMRGGQAKFTGSALKDRKNKVLREDGQRMQQGPGWPLAKSLTGIPTLYPWSLAYGRNLLTGQPSPAGQWRIRNVIVWARPNPPVGALGDKFRPATSYITVACRGVKRYFDLDAVRTEYKNPDSIGTLLGHTKEPEYNGRARDGNTQSTWSNTPGRIITDKGGAPPLDWHTDLTDGDWLWKLSTQPYAGAHYATFPMALPKRLIEAMCPLRVCTICGRPSERIVEAAGVGCKTGDPYERDNWASGGGLMNAHANKRPDERATRSDTTLGWSDCGHNQWRTGIVLDPFAGSGTTLDAAQAVGRHAIGIDLDPRNADLARNRVGMFLTISEQAIA